jgi:hypothetical protein
MTKQRRPKRHRIDENVAAKSGSAYPLRVLDLSP